MADYDSDEDSLFLKLKSWVRTDREDNSKWYSEAKTDFGMYSGGDAQWEPGDLASLEKQFRPHTTFNFIQPSVSAVIGMEVSNRQEVTFLPRTTQTPSAEPQTPQEGLVPAIGADDQGPAEVLTAAGQYFRDQCDAEDEESDAFQDTAICGMGWTETRVDYEEEPEGKMLIDRCDPLEMGWDSRATKRNLADARRLHRVREMDRKVAEAMFPGHEADEIDAAWARPQHIDEPVDREQAREYRNESQDSSSRKTLTVVEITWYEVESAYRVANRGTGEIMEDVTAAQLKTLRERAQSLGIDIVVAKSSKRVYRYAFLGGTSVLADAKKDRDDGILCQSQKGFKFQPITGTRDRNKRQWMGIVRAMRDPQRWTNGLYSSALNNFMTGGKGIMAERGAFEKPEQAEADWTSNDKIVFLKTGALSGANPMIKEKTPSPLPPGTEALLQFAMSAMRGVSGVNLELLGGADRAQAASLEYQRRQAATTILAPFFDGLRRYRKDQGRVMLDLIREYMSDGRLIRIVGPDYEKYVPLVKDESVTEFDIVVAESPASPNQKEASWMTIQQLLPMLGRNLSPKTGAILLKASPLPISVVNEFRDAAKEEEAAAANAPPPPEVQLTMAQVEKTNAETEGKQVDNEIKKFEAETRLQMTQMDMADRGEQRKHDVAMRGMDMQAKRQEMQGATDSEFVKSAGPGMMEKFDALGQGMTALAQSVAAGQQMIAQGLQAQAQAIGRLAAATAAPRKTDLIWNGDMPVGAISNVETVQ